LLEVLIAIAIFAVIGMMAMGGYNELSQQSERVTASMQRTRAIQLAMVRFTQDFSELEPRPVRDALGSNFEPALLADARTQALVQLTRAGWSNPAGISRSTLQRVAYRLADGKLYRDHWPVLDRTLATEPIEVELLDKVRSARFRFLDKNRVWSDQWPASSTTQPAAITPPTTPAIPGAIQQIAPAGSSSALNDRPIAVEVTLDLEDWGTLVRLLEVPG
jgi:general secretion pathway protein J